jgi:flagellar motility protein MotE (MotC chaperone)
MSFLIRFWYVLVLAFILSLGSALAVLFLTKEQWMPKPPPPPPDPIQVASDLAEMSEPYLNWNYATNIIDELRVEYDDEASALDQERSELLNLRKQIQSELKELAELRKEINALSESVSQEFMAIESAELDNLKRLAKVYEEMKPVPVVELFKQMELDLVVKLMSQISPAAASKILAEMSNAGQGPATLRTAVQITEELRKIKK